MVIRGKNDSSHASRGYTILEVMIFIAVSAFMLIAAMSAIGGRQEQVQFSQSVRDIESKIGDVMNDVTTGYYPASDKIECRINNGTKKIQIIPADASSNIGLDKDCMYVGKVLQFQPSGSTPSDSTIMVYNLVGKRFSRDRVPSNNIDEADPKAVADVSSGSNDPIEQINLRFGVHVTKVFERTTSGSVQEFGLVGFIANFDGSGLASSVSGGQTVRVGGIKSNDLTKFGLSKTTAVDDIINHITEVPTAANGYINTNTTGIVVCLTDLNNRKASITIGGNNSSRVFLQIDDYDTGCNP